MENKDTKKDVNPSLDKFFLNAEDKNQDLDCLYWYLCYQRG
jgi:hypothetical protein